MRRLLDLLLTTDTAQRTRLVQAAMVTLVLAALALALLLLALAGEAPLQPVLWWALLAPGGALLLFALVRSGWTRRFEDPALTVPQLVGGSAACALAYGLAGAARGGVFLVLMGLLMAALMSATPRQMRQGCIAAAVLLALAMIASALRHANGWPWVEAVHLLLLAALLPAAPLLASRWARMRARRQRQKQDLEAALVRIRELATRDELTGLVNRRQMRELMGQEHQRCIRSGRTFCLGVLDIDHFRAVNDRHGRSVGDAVLRSVAHEALRRVRVSDAFARWGGDRFVLLLADARAPLAKGGLERVRSGVGNMHVAVAAGELRVTLSAGLAEHHAGETVEQTLDRAERALDEAKQQGRDRLGCLS